MHDFNSWPTVLDTLIRGEDLTIGQASWAMEEVMQGRAADALIGGLLVGLRAKGETVDELIGFRDAALSNALPLPGGSEMLDIVGTGGDRLQTVNISTMASILVAASGVPVLKHGNRAVSSLSGTGDVLQVLGLIPTGEDPEIVRSIFDEVGISFAHAARFHPGFRHAAGVRKALGVPTVFNVLGPLINPARPEASALGVADRAMIEKFVGVFATRGATALVFRGEDGLDEVTTTGYTQMFEVSRGDVLEYSLDPRELGIPRAQLEDFRGGDPEHNAKVVEAVFAGAEGPIRDIVRLNAAVGRAAWSLHLDPREKDIPLLARIERELDAVTKSLDAGHATEKLAAWRSAVQSR
ncbi:MAG TPA: anthranilate phosphoribosyltransferase [Candidatus Agrococcus pullicola]|uniref:Anthranilate phosphoribosyltransferase n=1 Tax=Candidatus Agrococcus pullicola TaxID=2838429 RepID=A0A9D1YVN2_9MICO|nr:anthranilate phosphoribosyltransferase [Candidatus Agrococcus pullicola]